MNLPSAPDAATGPATLDRLGRPLRDLRVSVTDRCNFRCRYCMPREVFGPDFAFLPRRELLSFEEITRVVRLATDLGVRKVRLTGGEPLLRRGLADLVAMLRDLGTLEDIALTTNASLLRTLAPALADAGLHRVTVSLDSLDAETFRAVSDTEVPLATVLDGIEAAAEAGLTPVKINAVVKRGVNDHEIVPLAAWAREQGHALRFIEFMDVGTTNNWDRSEVVTASEILEQVGAHWPLEAVTSDHPEEPAERFRYLDGAGELGVIASVSRPFCQTCTRARLSAIGEIYTCLFGSGGTSLRDALRDEAMDDDELRERLAVIWRVRTDRYSELRATTSAVPAGRVEMPYIGG